MSGITILYKSYIRVSPPLTLGVKVLPKADIFRVFKVKRLTF